MTHAARSVQVFGLYLMAVGCVALTVPNMLFGLLGLPSTDEPWMRILGVVVVVLGGYYLVAARHELVVMFRATVAGRVVAGVALMAIVGVWGYWPAVAFGVVDLVGALWTWFALRRDETHELLPAPTDGDRRPYGPRARSAST